MLLPDLGVGINYAPGLEPALEACGELVSVVEIEPQTMWYPTRLASEPFRVDQAAVARVRELPQAKIVHGVGLPCGGSLPPDPGHLRAFAQSVHDLEAPWASEHLSFNVAKGSQGVFETGFMLPPLQTARGVGTASASIRRLSSALDVPFAVETGVNYLRPRPGDLPDGEFIARVVERADCGILLDLHNVWANARNGRQRLSHFLAEIPLDRVWEIHLAGGMEHEGYWLDAHSGAVPNELLEVTADLIPRLPNLHALIFEMFPPFLARFGPRAVASEVEKLLELWALRTKKNGPVRSRRRAKPVWQNADRAVASSTWESSLGTLAIGRPPGSPLEQELAQDPGLTVIQMLVNEFRAGTIVSMLRLTSRFLFMVLGESGFRRLLAEFAQEQPPHLFGSTEADAFRAYLEQRQVPIPHLLEVLAFERAADDVLLTGESRTVLFRCEPERLLTGLLEGEVRIVQAEEDHTVHLRQVNGTIELSARRTQT